MNTDLSHSRGARALHFFVRNLVESNDCFNDTLEQGKTESIQGRELFWRWYHFNDVQNLYPISLYSLMIKKDTKCMATVFFWPNLSLKTETDKLLWHVIKESECHVLFGGASGICLGNFFKYHSVIRQNLQAFLLDLNSRPFNVDEVGIELWNVISRSGGLRALSDIWQELFDRDFRPQMLRLNPQCFD